MKYLVILTLCVLLISCSSNQIDSFSSYKHHNQIGDGYSSYKNEIYYKRPKACYSSTLHFPIKTNANYKTFSLSGNRYAEDKDNIFYRGEIIPKIDKSSFLVIQIENVFPFYKKILLNPQFDKKRKQNDIKMSSSSLTEFTIANEITELEFYAKDKRNIYYGKNIISNADNDSFQVLSILFSKDNLNVYYKGKPIPNCDSETFKLIGGYFAQDRNHIYWGKKNISNNPKKFELLSSNYAKDDKTVWFFRQMIFTKIYTLDVNIANTFEIIINPYAKDSEQVFFHGSIIENADVDSFEILGKKWSKDDRNIFFCSKLCKEADYDTFEVTDEYVKDKNRYYDKKYRPRN